MEVVIIGAGASGLLAAIETAKNGAAVTLLEKNKSVGRKLLVTGSGRCNLSNANARADRYVSSEPAWLETVFAGAGVRDTLNLFERLGVPVKMTDDGWYYPLSESAQTVVDALHAALRQAGVSIQTEQDVINLTLADDSFRIATKSANAERTWRADRVIVAAGGKAYPELGSTGDLFPMLTALGHSQIPLRPGLAPIACELGEFAALKGQRFDAAVRLLDADGGLHAETRGNMIVTDWGFNGPAVMDLSNFHNPEHTSILEIDLLAPYRTVFEEMLRINKTTCMTAGVLLGAFLQPKVRDYVLRLSQVAAQTALAGMTDQQLARLRQALSHSCFAIKSLRGYSQCQVTRGGIPLSEVNPETMESRHVRGLHLCGELLDVVGPCGGYNLQFAFSTGMIAGRSASQA